MYWSDLINRHIIKVHCTTEKLLVLVSCALWNLTRVINAKYHLETALLVHRYSKYLKLHSLTRGFYETKCMNKWAWKFQCTVQNCSSNLDESCTHADINTPYDMIITRSLAMADKLRDACVRRRLRPPWHKTLWSTAFHAVLSGEDLWWITAI